MVLWESDASLLFKLLKNVTRYVKYKLNPNLSLPDPLYEQIICFLVMQVNGPFFPQTPDFTFHGPSFSCQHWPLTLAFIIITWGGVIRDLNCTY